MVAAPIPAHPWVAEGTERVRFGITGPPRPDWGAMRDLVQSVEALGFDSFWVPDHPMILGHATWTTLAALATVSNTIRLGPLVACAAYWNPVILARAIADIDRLSGGRAVLGLGSGDAPPEFAQLGVAWGSTAARQARLEETLRIVRPLLRGETVSFTGEYAQADGAVLNPPPVQQPSVPILVAGGGERTTLRYVAEHADACNLGAVGWAGGAYTPEDISRKLGIVDAWCTEVARPQRTCCAPGSRWRCWGRLPKPRRLSSRPSPRSGRVSSVISRSWARQWTSPPGYRRSWGRDSSI